MDMALFLQQTGDLDGAKEKFHRLLEMDPDFRAGHALPR